jgi:integrase/recombinase XerD
MTLAQAVEQYIEHKLSLGMKFNSSATILRSFARVAGDVAPDDFNGEQVRTFLFARNCAPQTASRKWSALRGFYSFAVARKIAISSPLPATMPRVSQRLVPHIYTEAELQRLLQATAHLPLSKLQPHTRQALMLILYGAGLRISEALRLVMSDVDLVNRLLNIRLSKFYKERLVPVGSDLTFVPRNYTSTRRYLGHSQDNSAPFFVTDTGQPISIQLAEQGFRRLCKLAQVERQDGGRYQPRLHDLRHSFAVHRLIAWYKAGAEVNRMLPKLSTYLGHRQLSYTICYLTMTPELLQQAICKTHQVAGS